VYVPRETADAFVHGIIGFSQGEVVSDDLHADAAELRETRRGVSAHPLDSHSESCSECH
jgi:hypothetical protein